MKRDPLITYRSLIPGGLHYIPGGFNPPPQERKRREDSPSESPCPSSILATGSTGAVRTRIRKVYAAFFSWIVTRTQPQVTEHDQLI
jgi:hypothetical protein